MSEEKLPSHKIATIPIDTLIKVREGLHVGMQYIEECMVKYNNDAQETPPTISAKAWCAQMSGDMTRLKSYHTELNERIKAHTSIQQSL